MRMFSARRLWSLIITATIAAVISVVMLAYSLRLHASSFASGWSLLAVILVLALYNLRKKLTLFPLMSSSTWLQLHIYVGLLSVVLFLWHAGLRRPTGPLEITLAALYVGVAGSGLIGLWLSRVIPAKLTVRGHEVLFERIPFFRRQLREQAEQLVFKAIADTGATTLADFYQDRLSSFFSGPRHVIRHLCQSARPCHMLLTEMRSLGRYLSDQERPILQELLDVVDAKDALDYHFVMQALLKAWLFVHIPLTYLLLILVGVHVVLVYAYSGGI